MSDELRRAVGPVREYLRGDRLTPNTILAAYLRARALKPVGTVWEIARAAYNAGVGFEASADAARDWVDRGEQDGEYSIRLNAVADAAAPEVQQRLPASPALPRRAVARETSDLGPDRLEWFPKPFGPGDLDGDGAQRLLGAPNLDLTELLVREMAQNSWDARIRGQEATFRMDLRYLRGRELAVLRERFFPDSPPNIAIPDLLEREGLWCLEVSDRGTAGLNGPVRNDRAVPVGAPRNFIDLVLNVGAQRDTHLGGGTYGYGKTISYIVSEIRTVIIWSRSREGGKLEDRLIGSAIGSRYDQDGYSYTGRHWWGVVPDDRERIEPLRGPMAQNLAENVFTSRFRGSETGTSFLILAPKLRGDTAQDQIQSLVDAITDNLWPKLLSDQRGRDRMTIRAFLDGEEVVIPRPEDDPRYATYAKCLQAVRRVQSGQESEVDTFPPVHVAELRSQRPPASLGHLALMRVPRRVGVEEERSTVAWMRHEAELVVRYRKMRTLDVPGFEWMGVFKPTDQVDDSFAAAEPPAHDDWVPASIEDSTQRTHVNVALRKMTEVVAEFLKPSGSGPDNQGPTVSVAHLGDALADLVATGFGSAPSTRTTPKNDRSRARTKTGQRSVQVVQVETLETETPGFTQKGLKVQIGPSKGARHVIEVVLSVGVEGGSLDGESLIRSLGWGAPNSCDFDRAAIEVGPDSCVAYFFFEHAENLAIDVRFRVEEAT